MREGRANNPEYRHDPRNLQSPELNELRQQASLGDEPYRHLSRA